MESFLKRTAQEAVVPASVGLGLAVTIALAACSQGSTSQDATAGSTTTSQGGTGGSATSQGALDGAAPRCLGFPWCNPSDQQVIAGPESGYSGNCPPERDCYTLVGECGSTLCMLPEGMHCDDPQFCDPGDTKILWWNDADCEGPSFCYEKTQCSQHIECRTWRTTACSDTLSDGGLLEAGDASADGDDAGTRPCCGDGVPDFTHGEQCDLGRLNGACLDDQGNLPEAGQGNPGDCPVGTYVQCFATCQIPIINH
jgi:hypothetical protein